MADTAPAAPPPADPDAERWDDPPRLPPSVTAPVLVVDGFDGPLDWLLEMARSHKIDLARLSILALVKAFASAMDAALNRILPTPELARWASWTVMAAQLTELRSRLLLRADLPEAQKAQAQAEALRRQWISRAEMAAAADRLDQRLQLGRDVFARGRPEPVRVGQGDGPARAMTNDLDPADDDADDLALEEDDEFTELLRACLVALRLPVNTEVYQPRRLPFWSVGEATKRISQMLPGLTGGAELEVFLPDVAEQSLNRVLHRRAAIAATLIAGLELARSGALTLEQEATWQAILIAREVGVRVASGAGVCAVHPSS
ncbi:MAG: segregation and condensation protein A [Janthinobacterium lividum]